MLTEKQHPSNVEIGAKTSSITNPFDCTHNWNRFARHVNLVLERNGQKLAGCNSLGLCPAQ